MAGKKILKKLTLRKEEIVNLNDFEMNVMRGGTGLSCATAVISAVTAVASAGYAGYELGKEESWWNCPVSQQANCMSAVSQNIVWYNGQGMCGIPEVVIYGV